MILTDKVILTDLNNIKITKSQKYILSAIILLVLTISMIGLHYMTDNFRNSDKTRYTTLLTNGTDQDLNFNESSVIIIYCNPKNTTYLCEHYMTIAEKRTTPIWLRCDGAISGEIESDKVHDFIEFKCLEE